MRRLKTIDELYEEVRDYGLVITNDAPLETALNARIDTPRIGPLAMTPRHIALLLGPVALGRPFLSDLELISKVSEETQLSFRHVYGDIQNFREIRRHTKELPPHLRFIHPSPDPRGLDGRVRSRRPPLRMVLPEG